MPKALFHLNDDQTVMLSKEYVWMATATDDVRSKFDGGAGPWFLFDADELTDALTTAYRMGANDKAEEIKQNLGL